MENIQQLENREMEIVCVQMGYVRLLAGKVKESIYLLDRTPHVPTIWED